MTVESNGKILIIDAGSGLKMLSNEMRKDIPTYPRNLPQDVNILLSHLHMDHVIGLGMFSPLWLPENNQVRIFTPSRDERPLNEQVFGVFSPPNWPKCLAETSGAQCIPITANAPFMIDHFTITPFVADHPDLTYSFHITDGEKTVVHLLDAEVMHMDEVNYNEMLDFCRGVDLVVFDAAYSDEDYARHVGWGHSTVKQGVEMALKCKPKRMLFAHFSQSYTDDQLDSWSEHFALAPETEFIMAMDGVELNI